MGDDFSNLSNYSRNDGRERAGEEGVKKRARFMTAKNFIFISVRLWLNQQNCNENL